MTVEELRGVYGDKLTDHLAENFAKIDAIDFTYTPEAQNKFGVDNKSHIGIKAQDLENVEATKNTVTTLDDGTKAVDADKLLMADTATIAELSRRVIALEEIVNQLLEKE